MKTAAQPVIKTPDLSANMDIIQSTLLTDARFDLKRLELQILIIIIAAAQEDLKTILSNNIKDGRQMSDFVIPAYDNDIMVWFSLNDFPIDMNRNERLLLEASKSLVTKTIQTHTEQGWMIEPFVSKVDYNRKDRNIIMTIRPSIWNKILDIRLGYTEYELFAALNLKSQYSVRFYMMAATDMKAREYSIEELKSRFNLQNKYSDITGFFSRVIYPAIRELDEAAPVTFEVKKKKKEGSKEITSVVFIPKKNPRFRSEELEMKKLMHGRVQVGMALDREEMRFLCEKMNFTAQELNSNYGTFNKAKKVYGDGLLDAMSSIYEYMLRHSYGRNKGYFIKALQRNSDRGGDTGENPELFPRSAS